MNNDEFLIQVNARNEVVGPIPRKEAHRSYTFFHRAVHVLLFSPQGNLLLQRRSWEKESYPGKWDTSVGGHALWQETNLQTAIRETEEELGIHITPTQLWEAGQYLYQDSTESEWVALFFLLWQDPVSPNPREVAEVAYFPLFSLSSLFREDLTTPHFIYQWSLLFPSVHPDLHPPSWYLSFL